MTTSEPDPRTDLAGWLGLKPTQVSRCRSEAEAGDGTVAAAVGRRIIAQDQADTPDPEPDDGLIAVTARLTAEQVRATAAIHPNSFNGLDYHGQSVCALNAACRAVDLPTQKPPWTSPLPNLPDLTEAQCRDAYGAGIDPYCYDPWAQIGRALKAAGWTPEEADRGSPTPTPGSDEALELGCRCPVLDNAHGRGARGTSGDDAEFWTNAACPLHGATISDPKETP